MTKIEPITIKANVEVIITPQAQKVIAQSKHDLQTFIDWALKDHKISLGGNNATIFLEHMFNREDE